ncbi:MAG: hypothetical protein AAF235_09805, partial [Planctomycetota bacterium]
MPHQAPSELNRRMTLGSTLELGISIAGRTGRGDAGALVQPGPKPAIDWAASLGLRRIQLDAAMPGLRARELGRSARRDLVAFMRRRGVTPSGLDLWIPAAHFASTEHADRAVSAVIDAIGLAAEAAALAEDTASATLSLTLGEACPPAITTSLAAKAEAAGVRLETVVEPTLPAPEPAAEAPAADDAFGDFDEGDQAVSSLKPAAE